MHKKSEFLEDVNFDTNITNSLFIRTTRMHFKKV